MDRLSVSFAPDYERERTSWSDHDSELLPPLSPGGGQLPSDDASVKINVFDMTENKGGGGASGGGGGSPSPVMPPGQGQSSAFNSGNRLSVAAIIPSGLE